VVLLGYTEKPLIVMGQQVSMGENGYFPQLTLERRSADCFI